MFFRSYRKPPPRNFKMIDIPNNHGSPSLPDHILQRISAFQQRMNEWGGKHILHGCSAGTTSIRLFSNDYLSLRSEANLKKQFLGSVQNFDNESVMSAVFLHGDNPTSLLEAELANWLAAPATIICQSGWTANVGLIQTIANPTTPVYVDALAHMSLRRGVHAAGAHPIIFSHNQAQHAFRQISKHGPGIIVVDAVYSTNGSLCPLEEFVELAEATKCVIVVDESHALGTHGPEGSGLARQYGLESRIHFRTASLAKAFAGRAGLIACPANFKTYFGMESLPAIFSSRVLDHEIAWLAHALTFIAHANDRRTRLKAITRKLRADLMDIGFNIMTGTEQIIALETGSEHNTMATRDLLEANEILGSIFCWPATPRNRALVRLSLHAGLTDDDVCRIAIGCRETMTKLDGKIRIR